MDCKAELLQSRKEQEGQSNSQSQVGSFSQYKCNLEEPEFGGDNWDYNRNQWSKKKSDLCTYECWKCWKPGHLAEDCLVMTPNNQSLLSHQALKTGNQVTVAQDKPSSIPRDLVELYRRCHQIGRNILAARCNACRSSATLATCLSCSNTFCDRCKCVMADGFWLCASIFCTWKGG